MKFSREQIVGYIILMSLFILCGLSIKFPLFAADSDKRTLFQSSSAIELFFIIVGLSLVYFLVTYFFPLSGVFKQLKAYQEPLQKVYNEKFDYWLKSLLYENEIAANEHIFNVESIKNRIQRDKHDVLLKAAELNDMKVETFIKKLTAIADANVKDAKSEMEKAKAETLREAVKNIHKLPAIWQAYIVSCLTGTNKEFQNDLDIQREISEFVRDLKDQEVEKSKAETETFKEKMKKEKKKYTSNDKV